MTHVWNSKMGGAASMQVELLESIIPHDRRELALALFHENDYSINGKILLFGRRRILLIEYDTIPPPKFFPDPMLSRPCSNFPTNITSNHHHHPGILEKVMIPRKASPARRTSWAFRNERRRHPATVKLITIRPSKAHASTLPC